jgi:hypothetical protein
MSLHNFNPNNKSWRMYVNTLSSISGDNLTIKPDERRNLLLEVSGNNNIFIKKGDTSYNLTNLITGTASSIISGSDASFSNIDVSRNLNPLTDNSGSLGSLLKRWANAYIRDISATNMSISGNINISGNVFNVRQIIPNDISNSLGTSLNTWQRAFIRDLSNITKINGTNWPPITTPGPTGAQGPIGAQGTTGVQGTRGTQGTTGPAGTSGGSGPAPAGPTGSLGPTGALITTTSQRIYQNINSNTNWNAVNGYYGLAQQTYPALNPSSSGVKAVRDWTLRSSAGETFYGICWSPRLSLFVATNFASVSSRVSINGITWTPVTLPTSASQVCWSEQLNSFIAAGASIMRSIDGTTWATVSATASCRTVCWSPELILFVVVTNGSSNNVITSINGTSWSPMSVVASQWSCICWSPNIGLFVAVSASNGHVMTSSNGSVWNVITVTYTGQWATVCWSSQLGLFVALSNDGKGMTSTNGTIWAIFDVPSNLHTICWSPQLRLFVAGSTNKVMYSINGTNWTEITLNTGNQPMLGACWSPELGIFVLAGWGGRIYTSSLKGRPPTSYNVFDSSFNSIDESGNWTFLNLNAITLKSNGTTVNSDNRIKHNEINITNGLDIIDQLCPKFYQKTQVMLDASYNGDLSGYIWNYEAGLIAQELLQISDISYVVSGGDYYEEKYNLITQTNDMSYNTNETSFYEVSNNLIPRPYNVNYNSVFIYGIAAIKELHAKVKSQESTILDEQLNSLVSRLEALE